MNRATKIVAAVLLALALGLAVLAIILGRQAAAPVAVTVPAPTAPIYPVVVAEVDLAVGAPIEAKQLKVVKLSISPTGTTGDINAFVGTKPARPIPAGRPIYDSDLDGGALVAVAIADGERAVSLTVDEIGGGPSRIRAGDFVDVFLTLRDQSELARSQVRLLLSRVRVMSYGNAPTDNPPAGQAGTVVRPATLVVPLAEVPRVLLAVQHGRVVLVLRAPDDDAVADAGLFDQPGPALEPRRGLSDAQRAALREPNNLAYAGINLGGLSRPAATAESVPAPPVRVPLAVSPASPTPRAAPRPAPTRQVEIIRGTQTEVVPF